MKRTTTRKKSSKKTKAKKAAPKAAKKEVQNAAGAQPRMIVERVSIEDCFLDCAIQQLAGVNILEYNELEGFPFKFGRVHVTEKLTAMLTPDAPDLDRDRLLCIGIMLGRIARHVNSPTLPRIIKLRKDMDRLYSPAASTAANASQLAGELEECHDLLLAELEFLDADARKAALQASLFSQTATKGEEGKSVKGVIDDASSRPHLVKIDGFTKEGAEETSELLKEAQKSPKTKFFVGAHLALLFKVTPNTISNWITKKVKPPEGFLEAYESGDKKAMRECADKYQDQRELSNIMNQKGKREPLAEAEAENARQSLRGQS